jgi:hypothetical protein
VSRRKVGGAEGDDDANMSVVYQMRNAGVSVDGD